MPAQPSVEAVGAPPGRFADAGDARAIDAGHGALGRDLDGAAATEGSNSRVAGCSLGELLAERLDAVHVALAAQGRGDDGDERGDRGEVEGQVQAVGERLLDQVGEERSAGDIGGLLAVRCCSAPVGPSSSLIGL